MEHSIEIVAPAICKTVGEAPHWEPVSKTLVYVDIRQGDIHKYHSETGHNEVVHIDGEVGFVIPSASGGYVVGQGPSVSLLDWSTAATSNLATADAYRFNDGKCDPSGRLWTGTLGPEEHQRALYSLDKDGTLARRLGDLQLPNGMEWNADASIMFFVDSGPRLIYAIDFEIGTGRLGQSRILVDYNKLGDESIVGKPDGMCMDTAGNLWVACYGGGKVMKFDSHTGEKLAEISIDGAKQITSCCFGGVDLNDLYVTSARSRLTEEQQKAQPMAGSLFRVVGLGAKGRPANSYCSV